MHFGRGPFVLVREQPCAEIAFGMRNSLFASVGRLVAWPTVQACHGHTSHTLSTFGAEPFGKQQMERHGAKTGGRMGRGGDGAAAQRMLPCMPPHASG